MSHVIRRLDEAQARAFLALHGTSPDDVRDVLTGFGFGRPKPASTCEVRLEEDDVLVQWMRLPSAVSARRPGGSWSPVDLSIRRGAWFALEGASMDGLAIFGGGSGRFLGRFRVVHPCPAIEGDAASLPQNWRWAGGGRGGATQIYVPGIFAGHLASLGPA